MLWPIVNEVSTTHAFHLCPGLTGEEVRTGFPELDRLVEQLAGTAVGVGHDSLAHGLDALLGVGVKEDDDGIPLGVVECVHCLGRHV